MSRVTEYTPPFGSGATADSHDAMRCWTREMAWRRALAGAALLLACLTLGVPSVAHEAHRKDMTDAEMAAQKQPEQAKGSGSLVSDATKSAAADATDQNAAKEFAVTDFLGALHPAAVHFPIALFLVAALAELILIVRPASGLEPTVRFLVYVGAAGGLVAAILGWFAAGIRMSDRSETLLLHRWTGTGIALAGLICVWLIGRQTDNRTTLRVLLAVIAAALVFQGYWGAEMSLGPDHLGLKG